MIVASEALNVSGFRTVIACTMTTKHTPAFLWRPKLEVADLYIVDSGRTPEPSGIPTEQIMTLDTQEGRFLRHVATVTNREKMKRVTIWLCTILGP